MPEQEGLDLFEARLAQDMQLSGGPGQIGVETLIVLAMLFIRP